MTYDYALSEWIVLNIEEHANNPNKRLRLNMGSLFPCWFSIW